MTRFKKCVVGCMMMLVAYFVAAWFFGKLTVHADRSAQMGDIDVFLLSNGLHTDIVMPVQHEIWNWHDFLSPLNVRDPILAETAEYIGIGWGSRYFYLNVQTWDKVNPFHAAYALSGLDHSALHVTYYPAPLLPTVNAVRIRISPAEYERLLNHITDAFAQTPTPIPNAAYEDNDAFYEAQGHYHLFYTCNTWVNQVLKKSGLKAAAWTPFSGTLLDKYRPE